MDDENFNQTFSKHVTDCVTNLEKYMEEPELSQYIDRVTNTVKDVCGMSLKFANASEMYEKMKTNSNNPDDIDVELNRANEVLKTECNKSNDEVDITSHFIWKSVKQNHPHLFIHEEGDSIICTQSTVSNIDPITKQEIQNTCKNSTCGHIYEYDSIMSYIKTKKASKQMVCPYIGCNNKELNVSQIIKIAS